MDLRYPEGNCPLSSILSMAREGRIDSAVDWIGVMVILSDSGIRVRLLFTVLPAEWVGGMDGW